MQNNEIFSRLTSMCWYVNLKRKIRGFSRTTQKRTHNLQEVMWHFCSYKFLYLEGSTVLNAYFHAWTTRGCRSWKFLEASAHTSRQESTSRVIIPTAMQANEPIQLHDNNFQILDLNYNLEKREHRNYDQKCNLSLLWTFHSSDSSCSFYSKHSQVPITSDLIRSDPGFDSPILVLFIYFQTSPRGLDNAQSKLHYEVQEKINNTHT